METTFKHFQIDKKKGCSHYFPEVVFAVSELNRTFAKVI